MALAMSKAEREAFLAETRVGVVSVAEEGRGPLTVPVWFNYEKGGPLRFVTGGGSKKVALLRAARRASLCVQTETPPYKYVSVEGPVRISTPNFERDVRQMARRYLGEQLGDWYVESTAAEREHAILVTLEPQRWFTVDYAKMVPQAG
jgi:PPOX class probable F420-dependent enzyme